MKVEAVEREGRCPLCREPLSDLVTTRCHSCTTLYHKECVDEMGGCATQGCAQQGMVPLDVDRPSRCPCCAELVTADSYDCICGARYHLECVYADGCIRRNCRLSLIPIGGRPAPFPWRTWLYRLSLTLALGGMVSLLYFLLVADRAEENRVVLAGLAFVIGAAGMKGSEPPRPSFLWNEE